MHKKMVLFLITFIALSVHADIIYHLISDGGQARVYKDGNKVGDYPEWYNYDLTIDANGNLQWQNIGRAGGGYAWIRNINNQSDYDIIIDLKDVGDGRTIHREYPDKKNYEFRTSVPWIRGSDYKKSESFMTLKLVRPSSKSVNKNEVVFSLISQGGNAIIRDAKDQQIGQYPERRMYDMFIDENGNPTLNDVGLRGRQEAWIRNIINPFGHTIKIQLSDIGNNRGYSKEFNKGENKFEDGVPWKNDDSSYMRLIIGRASVNKPKKPFRSYELYVDKGYGYIKDLDSGEIIDESAGEFADYNLVIGPRGALLLQPIKLNTGNKIVYVSTILNKCGYQYFIDYKNDKPSTFQHIVSRDAERSFGLAVPWNWHGNYFKISIEVTGDNDKACNGYEGLCDMRLNDVTFVKSHNGLTKAPDINHILPLNNQDRSFKQQLYDGVRSTKVTLFWQNWEGKDQIVVCHGWRDAGKIGRKECLDDPGATPLIKVLTTIREFLDSHPREVFILDLENVAKTDDIIKKLNDLMDQSGARKYLYANEPTANWTWPTLRQLINSNKRLVVIGDIDAVPWIVHYWTARLATPFSQKSLSELMTLDPNFKFGESAGPAFTDRFTKKRSFLDLNHNVTPLIAGDKNIARDANKLENIIKRANFYADKAGIKVNFVDVDFYQVPQFDAFYAANQLNNVSCK